MLRGLTGWILMDQCFLLGMAYNSFDIETRDCFFVEGNTTGRFGFRLEVALSFGCRISPINSENHSTFCDVYEALVRCCRGSMTYPDSGEPLTCAIHKSTS